MQREFLNPFLLVKPPWGDFPLEADKDCIVIVDNKQIRIKELKQRLSGEVAYVMGANQKSLNHLCEFLDVKQIDFYQLQAADLSPICQVSRLKHLAIRCNTKVEAIAALSNLALSSLILEDTPRLADLEPLGEFKSLSHLTYSGGQGRGNVALTLEPLARIQGLKELVLTNLRIRSGGLEPLASCRDLKQLVISNQFSTEEFALLSVCLPSVECRMFQAWVPRLHQADGEDVMVVGSKKPFLMSSKDSKRIASYEKAFSDLQLKFISERGLSKN